MSKRFKLALAIFASVAIFGIGTYAAIPKFSDSIGASITEILATDLIKDSRAVINANFSRLNTFKLENSDFTGSTGITYTSTGTISFDCSEVEGTGINCLGENITLDATGDWTGTLDTYNASDFLLSSASTSIEKAPNLTDVGTIADLASVLFSTTNASTTALTVAGAVYLPAGSITSAMLADSYVSNSASSSIEKLPNLSTIGSGTGFLYTTSGALIATSTIMASSTLICDECMSIGTHVKAGTLTDTKYCTWDNANSQIVCNSEGGSGASGFGSQFALAYYSAAGTTATGTPIASLAFNGTNLGIASSSPTYPFSIGNNWWTSDTGSTTMRELTVDDGINATSTLQIGAASNRGCVKIRDKDDGAFSYEWVVDGQTFSSTDSCE